LKLHFIDHLVLLWHSSIVVKVRAVLFLVILLLWQWDGKGVNMLCQTIMNPMLPTSSSDCEGKGKKGKIVPLHAMEALWVRGGIAPTLS
jgi:hypothetical protein